MTVLCSLPFCVWLLATCFEVRGVSWGSGVVYNTAAYPRTAGVTATAVDMSVDTQGVGPMQNKHAMACTSTDVTLIG
jgi:hypothetical protein